MENSLIESSLSTSVCHVEFDLKYQPIKWSGRWLEVCGIDPENAASDLRSELAFLVGTESTILDIYMNTKSHWVLPVVQLDGHVFHVEIKKSKENLKLSLVSDSLRVEDLHQVESEKTAQNPFFWKIQENRNSGKDLGFLRHLTHDLKNVLQALVCYVDMTELEEGICRRPEFVELDDATKKLELLVKMSKEYYEERSQNRSSNYEELYFKDLVVFCLLELKKNSKLGFKFNYRMAGKNQIFGLLNKSEAVKSLSTILACLDASTIKSIGEIEFSSLNDEFQITFFSKTVFGSDTVELIEDLISNNGSLRTTELFYLSNSLCRLNISVKVAGTTLIVGFKDSIPKENRVTK